MPSKAFKAIVYGLLDNIRRGRSKHASRRLLHVFDQIRRQSRDVEMSEFTISQYPGQESYIDIRYRVIPGRDDEQNEPSDVVEHEGASGLEESNPEDSRTRTKLLLVEGRDSRNGPRDMPRSGD